MPLSLSDFSIEEIDVPIALDDSDAARTFTEMVRVRNDIEALSMGSYDFAAEPDELLTSARDPYVTWRCFVVRLDGAIVGRCVYEEQGGDQGSAAWVAPEVLPAYRRLGVGSALLDTTLSLARSRGRTVLQAGAMHPESPGTDVVTSPTGFGTVPAADPATRFLLHHGFRLAQVDRVSRLPLPSGVETPPAPEGYEQVAWEGSTPEEYLADMAVLHARMSTDPPAGEVQWEPEVWDEARVRDTDERRAKEDRLYITAATKHTETGRLVGFTDLGIPTDAHRPVMQWDTIVLDKHRGHRLGHFVKAANLARLDQLTRGQPAIYTWNAAENTHMLAVNEALGFVAVGSEGSWRRDL